ncbi:2TM domain-containing protein [Comamonas sp. J-3]|uniref:2TM domain-containing protein n=1 Tax=Comamonas trifloxystrobinivorans TaxID=3350256 RepID=UPI00372BD662
MLVQKLRLQRGWSQQQLADLSGLSVRTIQRIEQGKEATVESWKSLASVFEVDFQQLRGVPAMPSNDSFEPSPAAVSAPAASLPDSALSAAPAASDQQRQQEEWLAMRHVRKLRRFYRQLALYALIISLLAIINASTQRHYWWFVWPALGWGLGLLMQANALFDWFPWLGADWERKQVEKRLNRPL